MRQRALFLEDGKYAAITPSSSKESIGITDELNRFSILLWLTEPFGKSLKRIFGRLRQCARRLLIQAIVKPTNLERSTKIDFASPAFINGSN